MLFFIILICSYAASFFMPWWMAAIVAFLASLGMGKTSQGSFWAGFFGIAFVWIALALFKTVSNDHILATRVAHLFSLPGWGYLLILTAIIGGVVGGIAAVSGAMVGRIIKRYIVSLQVEKVR